MTPTTSSFAATSPTCGFSFRRADSRFTIKEIPSYRPIGAVAAHFFVRRWPLYVLACAFVFGLEYMFCTFVHVRLASLYASLIGSPLITVVVMVNVGADATGTLEGMGARVERIIERAWAIILIDVGITFMFALAFGSMLAADLTDRIAGILLLFLMALLVYAEPYLAVEPDVRTITAIPFALLRSMMLGWVNTSRTLSLLAIQMVLQLGLTELDTLTAKMGAHTVDLLSLAYIAITTGPLAALFTIAYLDTVGQEQRRIRR